MMNRASVERSYLPPSKVRALKNFNADEYQSLHRIGITMDNRAVNLLRRGRQALDSMYAC